MNGLVIIIGLECTFKTLDLIINWGIFFYIFLKFIFDFLSLSVIFFQNLYSSLLIILLLLLLLFVFLID